MGRGGAVEGCGAGGPGREQRRIRPDDTQGNSTEDPDCRRDEFFEVDVSSELVSVARALLRAMAFSTWP